jgi:hypothetical protein
MSKVAYILWAQEGDADVAASFDREALKPEVEKHLKRFLAEDVNLRDQTPHIGEFCWSGNGCQVRVGFRGCVWHYSYAITEIPWVGGEQ